MAGEAGGVRAGREPAGRQARGPQSARGASSRLARGRGADRRPVARAAAQGHGALHSPPGEPGRRHQAVVAPRAEAVPRASRRTSTMEALSLHATDIAPLVPELSLVTAICLVLLVDVFAGARHRGLTPTLTLLALVVSAALTVGFAQVAAPVILLQGMYIADQLGFALKLAGFLFVAVALLYSRAYLENRNILRGEYYVLSLTALLGIFVLISANNLVTVYLGVELLALSVYALVAFDRDSGVSAESAMKYFVLGAMASGALLYGMSLIYGLTGTLDLGAIAARLHAPFSPGVVLGLTFIVVAVA